MKITKKTILKSSLLAIIIFLLTLIILNLGMGADLNLKNSVIIFSILILSIYNLIVSKYSYSFDTMHWIFILVFYSLVPLMHYSNNYYVWNIYISNENLEITLYLVLLWIIFFKIGQKLNDIGFKKIKKQTSSIPNNTNVIIPSYFSIIVLSLFGFIFSITIINNVGLSNLFSRKTSALVFAGTNDNVKTLLIFNLAMTILTFNVTLGIICYKLYKKYLLFLIFNLILLLIVFFPTGVSRNSAGIIYFGLIVLLMSKINMSSKKNNLFTYIFLLGFLLIFPALNSFRNQTFENVNFFESILNILKGFKTEFLTANYDAFGMIAITYIYISNKGVTFGKQLFSSFFFFVPRAIWSSKSVGSGSYIFTNLGKEFTNVSSPLISEAMINFGILGIILFAFFVGLMSRKVDNIYWQKINNNGLYVDYWIMVYPYIISVFFFMMRGDLMTTWSKMSVFLIVYYILYIFVYHTKNIKIKLF